MKRSISYNFKKALLALCIFVTGFQNIQAQPELVPGNLTIPIAPGDRELSFGIPLGNSAQNNLEVWVFYSTKESDLNTINSNSFTSSRHYGRAIMLRAGTTIECHFVFPHTFHAVTPNADLFCRYRTSGASGLTLTNFPTCIPGTDIIGFLPGQPNTVKVDFNPLVVKKGECVYYRIYKRVKSGNTFNNEQLSAIGKFKMPDSFNIGIAGDSYGAGEGAPDEEFDLGDDGDGLWISCPCHRSKKSGLLKGVKKFINQNPEVAVDYSFTACSGAVTQKLGEEVQVTTDNRFALYDECGTANNPRQFQTIRNELIGNNQEHDEMQMLIMSIGGNNSGFGDIVVNYLVAPRNLAIENILPSVMDEYTDKINNLDEDYSDLNEEINEFFPEVRPIIGITMYPNPTIGLSGRCGCNGVMNPGYHCALHENDCAHSPRAEYELINDAFMTPLNNKVRQTNELFGWHVIENINAGNHGLCNCEDPYFNVMGSSYDHQGDIYGMVHPNAKGYREMYRDKVYNFVEGQYRNYKALYYLAVLFGWKSALVCPQPVKLNLVALNLVLKNSAILEAIKGLKGISPLFKDAGLRKVASGNDAKEVLTNATLMNMRNDSKIKAGVMEMPIAQSIIKTPQPKKSRFSIKPVGKNIEKIRSDLKNYLASQEFKARVEELKKLPSRPVKDVDPLDDLYNKYK